MINLLPDDVKRTVRAGRANTLLIRYVFLLLTAVAFILVALGVVYVYLMSSRAAAEASISENAARSSRFASVEQEAAAFNANLSTAKQILASEISYSKVILNISAVVPGDVVLTDLNLDAKAFGTSTTINAKAKSADAALALKRAFETSPLFSDVHFQTITVAEGDTSGYPYTINLSAIINKEAIT